MINVSDDWGCTLNITTIGSTGDEKISCSISWFMQNDGTLDIKGNYGDIDRFGYIYISADNRIQVFAKTTSVGMKLKVFGTAMLEGGDYIDLSTMIKATGVIATTAQVALLEDIDMSDTITNLKSAPSIYTDSNGLITTGVAKLDEAFNNYDSTTGNQYLLFPCISGISSDTNNYINISSLISYINSNNDNGLLYTTPVAITSNLSTSENSLYAEFYRDGTVKFKGKMLLDNIYPTTTSYITFTVPSGIVESLDTSLWFPANVPMSVTTGRNTGYGYFYMFSATALRFTFTNIAEFSTGNYWRMGFNAIQLNFGDGAFDESVL